MTRIVFLIFNLFLNSALASSCKVVTMPNHEVKPQVERARAIDRARIQFPRPQDRELTPMEQNLIWENEVNLERQIRSSIPQKFPVVVVSSKEVEIDAVESTQKWIYDQFVLSSGDVIFPMSPFNSSPSVPFQNRKVVFQSEAFTTASRTSYFRSDDRYFAVKLPSDYTNPSQLWSAKADLREEIPIALMRTRYIDSIDKKIGPDPRLILLRDVMAVYDKKTRNGILVRDISPLQDGHLYIPTFSLAKSFRERRPKVPYGEHDQKVLSDDEIKYAQHQAVAHALFLIRYGLFLEFPHEQNSLMQLDRNHKQTGAVVFRDMPDTSFSIPILRAIAPQVYEDKNTYLGEMPRQELNVIQGDCAYFAGINPKTGKSISTHEVYRKTFFGTIIKEVGVSLRSKDFLRALRAYHKRLEEKYREKKR